MIGHLPQPSKVLRGCGHGYGQVGGGGGLGPFAVIPRLPLSSDFGSTQGVVFHVCGLPNQCQFRKFKKSWTSGLLLGILLVVTLLQVARYINSESVSKAVSDPNAAYGLDAETAKSEFNWWVKCGNPNH